MMCRIKYSLIALTCLCSMPLAAQRPVSDTSFTQYIDTNTCANFTYIHYRKSYIINTVEMTRACGPDRSHLVYEIAELYDRNNRLLLRKENNEVIGNLGPAWPGRCYTDRELQADGSYSELKIVSPAIGRLECHIATYNAAGVMTSDKIIPVKRYNALAGKRNKSRELLTKGEKNINCFVAPQVPLIPFKGFND